MGKLLQALARARHHPGIRRVLGGLLVIGGIGFFATAAAPHWPAIVELAGDASSLPILIAGVALYAVTILVAGLLWEVMLRAVGDSIPVSTAVTIVLLSQIAKYVPGNVAYHLSRFGMSCAAGCRSARVVAAMTVEMGVGMVFASAVAVLTFALAGPALFTDGPVRPGPWTLALAGGAAILLPTLVVAFLRRTMRRRSGADGAVSIPGLRALAVCVAAYATNFLLVGFTMNLAADGIFGAGGDHLFLLTGVFAVAWVVGLVTPGAPAGIGVREAILLGALAPLYGASAAVGLALALRLVTTIGDSLMFLVGLGFRHLLSAPISDKAAAG